MPEAQKGHVSQETKPKILDWRVEAEQVVGRTFINFSFGDLKKVCLRGLIS